MENASNLYCLSSVLIKKALNRSKSNCEYFMRSKCFSLDLDILILNDFILKRILINHFANCTTLKLVQILTYNAERLILISNIIIENFKRFSSKMMNSSWLIILVWLKG